MGRQEDRPELHDDGEPVRVRTDEDGEIQLRSKGVMRAYHNLPELTEEVFTDDGWFKTGDIGEIDADGFLRITDRKKDLIKTSGGKYVAPQALEGELKVLCPYISQVLVHGGNIMVWCGHRIPGPEHRYAPFIYAGKGLWTGHFVNQVFIDIKYGGSARNLIHYVRIPDLVKKCCSCQFSNDLI